MFYEDEEMKHRKKSHKTVKKASHKHNYIDVIIRYPYTFSVPGKETKIKDKGMVVERCTICGKIGNQHWFETVKTPNGTYLQLSSNFDDVVQRHPNLDVYEINTENIGKYIPDQCKKNQEHKSEA
jgi:hypothetical protein